MFQISPALSVFLDMARAIAALLIVVSHIRLMFFMHYDIKGTAGFFYNFFTLLGDKAIMVFFVLSGYLIARSAHISVSQGNLTEYAVKRITRLWIVLIPALIMTFFWDKLTIKIFSDIGSFFFESRLTWEVFFGNVFFLQDIIVPRFGSNGPLWSLANEFWYYVLFPVMLLIYIRYKRGTNIFIPVVLLIAIVLFLPFSIIKYYIIWLIGAVVWQIKRPIFKSGFIALSLFIAFLIIAGFEFAQARLFGFVMEFSIAMSFALLINFFFFNEKVTFPKAVERTSAFFANFSFSLYLLHFPFLSMLNYYINNSSIIDMEHLSHYEIILFYIVVLLMVYMYAYGIYLLTERHTQAFQRWVLAQIRYKTP